MSDDVDWPAMNERAAPLFGWKWTPPSQGEHHAAYLAIISKEFYEWSDLEPPPWPVVMDGVLPELERRGWEWSMGTQGKELHIGVRRSKDDGRCELVLKHSTDGRAAIMQAACAAVERGDD